MNFKGGVGLDYREFEPDLQFQLGDKVIFKMTGKQGTITDIKWGVGYYSGAMQFDEKYYVDFPSDISKWINAAQLKPIYEFNKEWEEGFCNLMINTHLKHRNFETASMYLNKRDGIK